MIKLYLKFVEAIALIFTPLFRFIVNTVFPNVVQKRLFTLFFSLISFKNVKPSHYSFRSIQEFFTRAPESKFSFKGHISSPVQGFLYTCDYVHNSSLFHVKGLPYSLNELLPFSYANEFKEALFHSIYLSPQDCHRVYVPVDASLLSIDYVSGECRPVRDLWMRHYPNLFCRNERCVFRFQNDEWDVVLVMIAALNVGGIQINILPQISSYSGPKQTSKRLFEGAFTCSKGDRLATFLLGSSVVLITKPRVKNKKIFCMDTQKLEIGDLLI